MLAPPALLLLACAQQEAQVAVVKHGGAVAISVTRPGADEPPCVKAVTVTRDGADIADTPPLWELSTAQPQRCAATFVYGQAPTGYAQAGAVPPLVPGTSYLVEVSGPGLLGGTAVTMRKGDGPLAETSSR